MFLILDSNDINVSPIDAHFSDYLGILAKQIKENLKKYSKKPPFIKTLHRSLKVLSNKTLFLRKFR